MGGVYLYGIRGKCGVFDYSKTTAAWLQRGARPHVHVLRNVNCGAHLFGDIFSKRKARREEAYLNLLGISVDCRRKQRVWEHVYRAFSNQRVVAEFDLSCDSGRGLSNDVGDFCLAFQRKTKMVAMGGHTRRGACRCVVIHSLKNEVGQPTSFF